MTIIQAMAADIIALVMAGKRTSILTDYNLYLAPCNTQTYDPLALYIQGVWVEIHPSTYIITVIPFHLIDILGPRKPIGLCIGLVAKCR